MFVFGFWIQFYLILNLSEWVRLGYIRVDGPQNSMTIRMMKLFTCKKHHLTTEAENGRRLCPSGRNGAHSDFAATALLRHN